MNEKHEPECFAYDDANAPYGSTSPDCVCETARAAYRRGREDADKALERLHYPTDLGIWYGLPHLEGVLACNECENLFYEGGGEGERLSLWPCPTITAARGDGEQA